MRLSGYHGDAADLTPAVLQAFIDDVAAGRTAVPIDRVFAFEDIVAAHRRMESGEAAGKIVVLTGS